MKSFFIIQYISVIIWALPPLRQYKGNFFYYFLFVSLCDPLVIILRSKVHLIPSNIYVFLAFFAALISIIAIDKKVSWKATISVLIAVLVFALSIPNWDISYIQVGILAVIVYYSIRYILIFASKNRYVGLFHFLFLIYNSSLLFKLISAMVDPVMGAVYFYSTTIFEIILGILFCILREEDKLFALTLRGSEFKTTLKQEELIARKYDK